MRVGGGFMGFCPAFVAWPFPLPCFPWLGRPAASAAAPHSPPSLPVLLRPLPCSHHPFQAKKLDCYLALALALLPFLTLPLTYTYLAAAVASPPGTVPAPGFSFLAVVV